MNLPRQHTVATPYIVGPVHFYSGKLGGDLVLFDCGPPTSRCRHFLKQNIELSRLRHVIVTHGHVDHWGQALWLAEQGVTVYLPYADHLRIVHNTRRKKELLALLDDAGLSFSLRQQFAKISKEDVMYSSFPPGYRIVEEDLPKHLGIKVHSCPGHSMSDLVFEGDDWLISGDTLLDGIFQSPLLDVDLERGGRFHNYQAWCRTFTKLLKLEGKTVCPGHRDRPKSIRKTLLEYVNTLLYRVHCFLPYQEENDFMKIIDQILAGRIKGLFHIYLKVSELIFIKDFLNNPEILQKSLIKGGLYEEIAEQFEKVIRGKTGKTSHPE